MLGKLTIAATLITAFMTTGASAAALKVVGATCCALGVCCGLPCCG